MYILNLNPHFHFPELGPLAAISFYSSLSSFLISNFDFKQTRKCSFLLDWREKEKIIQRR